MANTNTTRTVPKETADPRLHAAKTQWPAVVPGYYRRTDLLARVEPLRALTVLRAPSGFGKTALLADVFQRWRSAGRLAAWLTVDEGDAAGIVDAYLALAFRIGGLPIVDMKDAWRDAAENEVPHRARRRTELLAAAIKAYGAACLLVLDDAERLVHSAAVDTINYLLQTGPANLHIALAMRDAPAGLDLTKIDEGDGVSFSAADLRFSTEQIDGFFNGGLSLREIAALEKGTEGWPVALRIFRNIRAAGRDQAVSVQQLAADRITAEWLGERLLRDLREPDRNLLLDLSLFEWITPTLAAEALGEDDLRRRIAGLGALDGLLQQGQDNTLRLNPLLREYCATRRRRQDRGRFQMLHRRIAQAEAQEGRVVQALRHASEAGDGGQVGRLLETAGGVRLWARFGVKSLIAVNEYLSDEVIAAFPRAALLRCTVLSLQSRFGEALQKYAALRTKTRGFAKDRAGGDDAALRADHMLVQSTLVGFHCMPLHSALVREAVASINQMVAAPIADPVVEGALHLSLSIVDGQRARFDAARRRGSQAKTAFDRASAAYGSVFINLTLGTAAMAQGRVREAAYHYGHGAPTAIADILSWEIEHERSCKPLGSSAPTVPTIPEVGWLDVYAAAFGVAAELAFDEQAALFSVEQARERARRKNLPTVARFLSALRITWLARQGLDADADRAWREDGLPTTEAEILDVDHQSWREMEALACGRARLLRARGDFASARELLRQLCLLADDRGLRRVLMNALALSVSIERDTGQMRNAVTDLADFLRLAEEADYLRPLARERDATLYVLPALLGEKSARDVHDAAVKAQDELRAPAHTPHYTARELAILRAFGEGNGNSEIAASLGINEFDLRAEFENIYRKSGAHDGAHFERLASEAAATLPRGARRNWRGSARRSRL